MSTPAENMMTQIEMCPFFLSRIIFRACVPVEMGTRRYNPGGSPAVRPVLSREGWGRGGRGRNTFSRSNWAQGSLAY